MVGDQALPENFIGRPEKDPGGAAGTQRSVAAADLDLSSQSRGRFPEHVMYRDIPNEEM
jgi:hypothetical protein